MLDTESRETLHILFGIEEYCRMLIIDKVRFDQTHLHFVSGVPLQVQEIKSTVIASEARQSK